MNGIPSKTRRLSPPAYDVFGPRRNPAAGRACLEELVVRELHYVLVDQEVGNVLTAEDAEIPLGCQEEPSIILNR